MSEYQYYEFQAIDRPLGEADIRALGGLSTRARITATSFVNHYNWGDFGGDPENMMERWFDLHLYLANWGTRRLMIRMPKRFLDRSRLKVFLREVDGVQVRVSGRNLIVDIWSEDEEREYDHLDDGPGLLGAMAPLRSDLLSGDLRLFYLLWLTAVEAGDLEHDEKEPLPGIGPLTGSLEAFADFFHIDPDLVQVAAEAPLNADLGKVSAAARRRAVEAIPHAEKTALLAVRGESPASTETVPAPAGQGAIRVHTGSMCPNRNAVRRDAGTVECRDDFYHGLLGRLVDGDPHVMVELQRKVREAVTEPAGEAHAKRRTVADLRGRVEELREARRVATAKRVEAERRRQAEEAERARRARIKAVRQRGESVWGEIETEIERRNPSGYDRAAGLIFDLRALAEEDGTTEEFSKRARSICHRHARKWSFLQRLGKLALEDPK